MELPFIQEGYRDLAPLPPGQGRGPSLVERLAGNNYTLTDLAGEMTFFTVGIVEAFGRPDRDLVQEYVQTSRAETVVALIESGRPFFVGMGNSLRSAAWDFRLQAARDDCWPALRRHLASAAFLDYDNGRAWKVFEQEVIVPDWLWVMKKTSADPADVPDVRLHAFCVAATDGTWCLEHSPLPLEPLRVRRLPTHDKLPKFFSRVLRRKPRPHDV